MSCDVHIDDRGLGTIQIPDSHGEFFDYRVTLVPRGLALWAARLTRLDKQEAEYIVCVFRSGNSEIWRCECKAFEFKKRGEHDCKHTLCMRALRAFLNQLMEPLKEQVDGQPKQAV